MAPAFRARVVLAAAGSDPAPGPLRQWRKKSRSEDSCRRSPEGHYTPTMLGCLTFPQWVMSEAEAGWCVITRRLLTRSALPTSSGVRLKLTLIFRRSAEYNHRERRERDRYTMAAIPF